MNMIKRILFLLLLSASLAQAAITRVGNAVTGSTTNVNAGSCTLTFGATPTAGNIIVVVVSYQGTTVGRMSEQTGITWLQNSRVNTTSSIVAVGRIQSNIASATVTFTITSGTQPIAMVGAEYSGTAIRVDRLTSAVGSSISPASGATDTTTNANEMWIGAIANRGTGTTAVSSPTNSFVIPATNGQISTSNGGAATDVNACIMERSVSSTGTANAGGTITSNPWQAWALTLEETPTTSGGGGSTNIPSIGS